MRRWSWISLEHQYKDLSITGDHYWVNKRSIFFRNCMTSEMESFGAYSIVPIVFAHGFCMIEDRDYYIEEIRKHEEFLASRANVHWMRNYRKNHVDDGLPF